MLVQIPPFGEIDLNKVETSYEGEVVLDGRLVTVDMSFDESRAEPVLVNRVDQFLQQLASLNEAVTERIREDFEAGGVVEEYIHDQLESITEDELYSLIDGANADIPPDEQLLTKLYLKRVGIYPDDENCFATFDYTIGQDYTDDLVVVRLGDDGTVHSIYKQS